MTPEKEDKGFSKVPSDKWYNVGSHRFPGNCPTIRAEQPGDGKPTDHSGACGHKL